MWKRMVPHKVSEHVSDHTYDLDINKEELEQASKLFLLPGASLFMETYLIHDGPYIISI